MQVVLLAVAGGGRPDVVVPDHVHDAHPAGPCPASDAGCRWTAARSSESPRSAAAPPPGRAAAARGPPRGSWRRAAAMSGRTGQGAWGFQRVGSRRVVRDHGGVTTARDVSGGGAVVPRTI